MIRFIVNTAVITSNPVILIYSLSMGVTVNNPGTETCFFTNKATCSLYKLAVPDRAPNLGLVERFNFGLLPRFNLSLVARFNFGLPT